MPLGEEKMKNTATDNMRNMQSAHPGCLARDHETGKAGAERVSGEGAGADAGAGASEPSPSASSGRTGSEVRPARDRKIKVSFLNQLPSCPGTRGH